MLQNQKVLVAGLGGTGISVLAYCAHIGAEAAGYDAQLSETQRAELTEKFPQFPLFAGSLHTAVESGNRRVQQFVRQQVHQTVPLPPEWATLCNFNTPEEFERAVQAASEHAEKQPALE